MYKGYCSHNTIYVHGYRVWCRYDTVYRHEDHANYIILQLGYMGTAPLQNPVNTQLGPWFNIKMSSYQYRKSHCADKTVVRSSYLHNGIPKLQKWHLYIKWAPRFRFSSHPAGIKTNRHLKSKLDAQKQICIHCDMGEVDDEIHPVTSCTFHDK